MHGALMNGNGAPSNGTMSSIRSGMEHRMSLNINPLNELEESYGNNEVCNGSDPLMDGDPPQLFVNKLSWHCIMVIFMHHHVCN